MIHAPKADRLFVRAGGLVDATGLMLTPASLLLQRDDEARAVGPFAWRVVALGGEGHDSWRRLGSQATPLELPEVVLGPGLVNAHTHLDLTALGPLPAAGGFAAWLASVRQARCEALASEEAVAGSVQQGVELSVAGGVVAVGDIAGRGETAAARALARSPLLGVTFIEAFGLGEGEEPGVQAALQSLQRFEEDRGEGRVGPGMQPHAPYSAGPGLFARLAHEAGVRGIPIASHVAESAEERRLFETASGPLRTLLEELGLWSDEVERQVCRGRSPVDCALEAMQPAPRKLLVHCNDVTEEEAVRIAQAGAFVVACPRSSLQLGHLPEEERFDHLQRLRRAGVRLCVATDSVASLPAQSADRLTPLDDAQLLLDKGVFEPLALLAMLTLTPAEALGLEPTRFAFAPGQVVAGVTAAHGAAGRLRGGPVEAFVRARTLELLLPAD